MKNLSKSDRIILVGIVFLLVLFIIYEAVLQPTFNKISIAKNDIKNDRKTVQELKNLDEENAVLGKSIKKLKEKYDSENEYLPIEMRDPDIEKIINDVAVKNNVSVDNITFGAESVYDASKKSSNLQSSSSSQNNSKVPSGSLMQVPVTINVTGGEDSVMGYMISLDKEERISEFTGINISDDKGSSSTKGNFIVNFYYLEGSSKDKKNIKYDISKS